MRQKFNTHATHTFFIQHQVYLEPTPLPLSGDVILEIGSGKGDFICQYAKDHPEKTCIAVEINKHVCYYIALKKETYALDNLIIILDDAARLDQYIQNDSIQTLYLQFSDPWPKAKHHKRRLTYPKKLDLYGKLLKKDGTLIFKTDHKKLYIESSFYVQNKFKNCIFDDDAHAGEYMTEYERKKRPLGPIYQIQAGGYDETL